MLRTRSYLTRPQLNLGVRRREQANALSLHEIIAERFGVVSASSGCVPPALSPHLGAIARHEHARRAIEIPI